MSYAEELRSHYALVKKRLNSGKYHDPHILIKKAVPKPRPMPMNYSGQCFGEMWLGIAPQYFDPAPIKALEIINAVLRVTDINRHDFNSHRRHYQFVHARHIAAWFMKNYTDLSFPQIGRLIGRRDHSTVLNGVRMVNLRPDLFETKIAKVAAILNVTLQQEKPCH